jgi:hypothetical protein
VYSTFYNFSKQISKPLATPVQLAAAHHSKTLKDGWAKYIPNFALKCCLHDRRTLGNKNENAVWVSF